MRRVRRNPSRLGCFGLAFVANLAITLPLVAQTSFQTVATGLSIPVGVTFAPGDNGRIFVIEQGSGTTANIKAINLSNGAQNTFMTVPNLVTGGERGLLGLTFHPDYQTNGQFYVNASESATSGNHQTSIRRYTAIGSPATATTADPASRLTVLTYNQPFSNHNGGWMAFNPNLNGTTPQYLYIAAGDGGSANDPGNRAQDITDQRLGKMLRIDINGDDFPADPIRNYAIPPTNPFVNVTGDDEIWSYGLRNPWRNSFDRLTGDLWIADVGQNSREEVNVRPASSAGGENYGWRVQEGNACFDNSQTGGNLPCNSPNFIYPIHEYSHVSGASGGFSITGGYVYRGSVPQYEGLYFFADYVNNNFWTLDPYANNITASVRNRNAELPLSSGTVNGISSFGEDSVGELYFSNLGNGSVHRLQSTSRRATWNGDAAVGNAGDGLNWSDANNWTRGGVVDASFVNKDEVEFIAGSSTSIVNLGGTRSVGGVRFESNYALEGGTLNVLSGNVRVANGMVATMNSPLAAESANASLRKLGPGRLLVNSTAGQTVALEGSLGGTGTIQSLRAFAGTTVAPGSSIGTLRVTQNLALADGSNLEIEIANQPGPGTSNDLLQVGGTANLDGTLKILPLGGGYVDPTAPGTVESYQVLTALSFVGTLDAVQFNGATLVAEFPLSGNNFRDHVGAGLFRGVHYFSTPSTATLTIQNYVALPGDANGDGFVDGSDFNIWNANKFLSGTSWTTGDFNGDGTTDGSDFNIWNANKFTSVTGILTPEPATWGSMCVWAWLMFGRRRRTLSV